MKSQKGEAREEGSERRDQKEGPERRDQKGGARKEGQKGVPEREAERRGYIEGACLKMKQIQMYEYILQLYHKFHLGHAHFPRPHPF